MYVLKVQCSDDELAHVIFMIQKTGAKILATTPMEDPAEPSKKRLSDKVEYPHTRSRWSPGESEVVTDLMYQFPGDEFNSPEHRDFITSSVPGRTWQAIYAKRWDLLHNNEGKES